MGQHTKIIEFYGLPGCGKSTLLDLLVNTPSSRSFCSLHTISESFKTASIWDKISSLPVKSWCAILSFLLSVPRVPVKKWKLYRSFFYISLMYRFCILHGVNCDYLVVDHGIFQAVVSVLYGHSYELTKKNLIRLNKIYCSLSIDYPIYCDISVRTSLLRVRQRGRKNNGRLDMLTSDERLTNLLSLQKKQFAQEFNMVSKSSLVLNMEQEESEIYSDLIKLIHDN